MKQTIFITENEEETRALGEKIGRLLRGGEVLALRGGLGAGKTCLTRGIAFGAGVTGEITSPTYTIISEYSVPLAARGETPFYHIDAWRLSGDDDFIETGGAELLGGTGICVIEWSERVQRTLENAENRIDIEMTVLSGTERKITVSGLVFPETCRSDS
jgi:tRNA threonylcarbamoyladenosine biosynthesis protein TsaE